MALVSMLGEVACDRDEAEFDCTIARRAWKASARRG